MSNRSLQITSQSFEKHTEIVDAAVQNLKDLGPPEDAWAEIAAESEHDREKQRV